MEIPEMGGMLCGERSNPILLLVGQYSTADWMTGVSARWMRFAYDAKRGFQFPTETLPVTPDNALLIRKGGSLEWHERLTPVRWSVEKNTAEVEWQPLPEVSVTTRLVPHGIGHIRNHTIRNSIDIEIQEGGFPCPGSLQKIEENSAIVKGENLSSRIECLTGSRFPSILQCPEKSNLIHPNTAVPILTGKLNPGTHELVTFIE